MVQIEGRRGKMRERRRRIGVDRLRGKGMMR